MGQNTVFQIGAVHIHSSNLWVSIGSIVIYTARGITAGGVNSNFVLIWFYFTAAPYLFHGTKNVEELGDAFFFG